MARRSNAGESVAILAKYNKMSTFKDTMAEATDLGNTLTTGGVTQRMMALSFREGLIAREKKMATHDVAPMFDAFASGWYGKDKGLGRKPLDAKSRKTMIGAYQHFTNAGLRGEGWRPLVTGIMEMTNTPVSTRGAKIGALLEKEEWATKAPDANAIAVATGKKKSGGKGKPKPYNGKGVLRGLCSNGEGYAEKADFVAWLQARPVYAPLVRDYLEAVAAIRLAMLNEEKDGSANRKVWDKSIKATTKAAARLPAAKGRRANAN